MQEVEKLKDKTIAILATDGFEEIELAGPKKELEQYGATVHLVADKTKITSWKKKQWGHVFEVDKLIANTSSEGYDALIIPGGVINADKLRRSKKAVEIIQSFNNENKLIAAICHGPQLLIEAGLVKGKTVSGHHAIKTDLINAGANYEDLSVAADNNIVTARGADDVPSFLKKIIGILDQPS